MSTLEPLDALCIERDTRLSEQGIGQQSAAHADPPVNAPD
jgi:hypothetical protein